ncbi:hypothetical protein ABZX30_13625 [Streptomyces sp. NPDC004542]|uniref:hypothetical protein n=1 Tax=Streptomyces sp. NPDC004542 TaxID=3154281 RepID=UPI0033AE53C5
MVDPTGYVDGPALSVLGPEGREQLGQVPTGTWRKLAPKNHGRLHRGRVHVVQQGDTAQQTQVLSLTDSEALGLVVAVR